MPKEIIGDIEVRWARWNKDETIDVVIPGEYLSPPGDFYVVDPVYMKTLRERRYSLTLPLDDATTLTKVLQKAVRQIESTRDWDDLSDLPDADPAQVSELIKALRKPIGVVDEDQLAIRLAELVERGNSLREASVPPKVEVVKGREYTP